MNQEAVSRARGALFGLAIGDALGMPTQLMSREFVRQRYGILDGFHDGPTDNPISRLMAAGRVTDDTDQTVILGRLMVAGGGIVNPFDFARDLLAWEQRMIAEGSLDLLGPSTRRALALLSEGASLDVAGATGATNGAAMRVAPVGIAFNCSCLPRLVDAVAQVGFVTHNTTIANAGAAAVAAAVSVGVGGGDLAAALRQSVEAARLGGQRGHFVAGADVAARSEWALRLVEDRTADDGLDLIYRLVGTGVSTQEAVPAALAVCTLAPEDPWLACRLAASLGGDCDTIAAIAGAVMGACHGIEGFPEIAIAQLRAANPDLVLERLADDLLELRDVTSPPGAS